MITFIDDHREAYGVEPICKVLPIAPSTYHAHVAQRSDPARTSARAQRDAALCEQMKSAASRLPPFKIGRYGNLQEWQQDYVEVEPGHRHISHLWALYPDDQITLRDTPDLAKACRVALNRRLQYGGGSTGWSRAWIVNCFARLEDGDRCHEQLMELIRRSTRENLFDVCGMKATRCPSVRSKMVFNRR